MRLRRLVRTALVTLGLLGLLAAPAQAEFFIEGQIWGEEFEDAPGELPQLELFQTITEKRFEAYDEVNLLFQLELGTTTAIEDGFARIRPRVFKADGSSINLPIISARVQESVVQVQRSTEVALERGDVIRWRIRFKGLPTVSQGGACQVIVGVTNRPLFMAN